MSLLEDVVQGAGTLLGTKTGQDALKSGKEALASQFSSACDAPARDTSVPVMDCKALDNFDFDKVEDALKDIPAGKINITSAKNELGEFLQKSLNALGYKTGVDGAAGRGTVGKLNEFFRDKVASEADNIIHDKFADLKTLPEGSKGITHLTGRHVQAIIHELRDRDLLDKDQVMARELGEGLRSIDDAALNNYADQLAPRASEWKDPDVAAPSGNAAAKPAASAAAATGGSAIAVPSSSLLGDIEDTLKEHVIADDINLSATKPTAMGKFIQEALNRLNANNGLDDKIPVTGVIDAGTIAKLNEFSAAKVAKEADNVQVFGVGKDRFEDLKQVRGASDISGRNIQALIHDLRGDMIDKEPDVLSNNPALIRSLSTALEQDVNNIALGNAAKELVKPPEPKTGIVDELGEKLNTDAVLNMSKGLSQ